ncbi:putative glycosyl hydrolase [Nocardia nova SH22a]|uniref:Putative glycosyl hydrolase n=1 Tax=Nocardia nova SH22a TaxID=1415166 RepID=W5TGN4_9NOCA|nr:family 1 glycosylhydrolase [Nocardia nova]AHH18520.1 putative glycosyl hydrolase [Nocardia nova SH22a]
MSAKRIGAALAAAIIATTTGAGLGSAQPAPLPALDSSFLWGVASSGFQSEGRAADSNWSRYASSPAAHDTYRDSVDFFDRYRSDIALARDLGVRVYRISVEWSRLQPHPGQWDEQGFRYYDDVVAAIRAAGMRPMLTLDHWAYPGWEADRGGWRNPGMVADWLANARRVVDRYAAADPLWVTFNEPAFYGFNETRIGALGPADIPAMTDRLVQAHDAIYDYIHARQPDAMVTSNVAFAATAQAATDVLFEDRVAAKLDYIGIDYYYGTSLAHPEGSNPANVDAPWELSLTPEGIYYALRYFARKFPGRPLFIVENGMPTDNGRPRADGWDRADALRDTIYWLQRADADGMNVIGYNYWSLTDNYEWGSYAPRYGLYTVDVTTDPGLTRKPTDAVAAYRDITAHDGVPGDYRPTRPPVWCSTVDLPSSCLAPVTEPR